MTFEQTIKKIDKEIYRLNERGKRIWFDIDVKLNGFSDRLRNYYLSKGYLIEIKPCKGCKHTKADIIITW